MHPKLEALYARLPTMIRLANPIVLVDVGASAGIQAKWLRYRHSIAPVLLEPNPAEAAALRATLAGFAGSHVIEQGLSNRNGPHTLHVAEYFGCTSMLEANMEFLGDYRIAGLYRSERTVEVTCSRYDSLVANGQAPRPDVIKIDIEGFESRALEGFGDLLHDVLGIETEAWFYPAFKDQALLPDLVRQLAPFGFRLRRIEPVPGFEGDLVCVNAFFTQEQKRYRTLDAARRAKFDLMSRVWRLSGRVVSE